jgi:hypothetical protein
MNKVNKLNDVLADHFLAMLASGDLSAQELAVITKYVKDNGGSLDVITSDSPVASILDRLPFQAVEDLNNSH